MECEQCIKLVNQVLLNLITLPDIRDHWRPVLFAFSNLLIGAVALGRVKQVRPERIKEWNVGVYLV